MSYSLCNLSSVGTNTCHIRFETTIFALYNAKLSNWSSSSTSTGITIATGLPWSDSYGASYCYAAGNYNNNVVGLLKMSGSSAVVYLTSNVAFDVTHIYVS